MTCPPNDNEENAPENKVKYPESPVPGDANLSEGELPFTAFGQFGVGSLDIRVFEQDKYWVDVQGTPFLLDEMDREYLLNVMGFLFVKADYYYVATVRKVALEILEAGMRGNLNADAPAAKAARSMAAQEPVQWLNSTRLLQKLHRLLDD
jgi:hypothetical protein